MSISTYYSGSVLNAGFGNLLTTTCACFANCGTSSRPAIFLLGDRAYGEYSTLAGLPRQGVDGVARLHQKRKVDFRKARRLGKNDGLFVWTKGCQQQILERQTPSISKP